MTAAKTISRRLTFPVLERVRLSRFSLYTLQDPIEFKLNTGIICLAGANGLGKSTFLQIITYGLTGVVPRPNQKFVTVDDYYRDILAFTRDYFDGRLEAEDKEVAEIELEMTLGPARITLRRGFVESDMLSSLEVVMGEEKTDYRNCSAEERQQAYEKLITESVGVASF